MINDDIPRVYFAQIGDAGLVKIGTTTNIPNRLLALRRATHAPLRLLGNMPGDHILEREWHTRFDHLQLFSEWFLPEADLLGAIAAVAPAEHKATRTPVVNVTLPQSTYIPLLALTRRRHDSLSAMIRDAVTAYLERQL